MDRIKHVILISGKRKCGKDFLSENLLQRLSEKRCQIVRISEPIKSEWAKKLNLNLEELLSDGPYKEQYRKDMIVWSDEVRSKDYGYFCKTAMKNAQVEIVIVSDIRRKNDIRYFVDTYGEKVKTIRLSCPEEVREQRGWVYVAGVDNVESECDLDNYENWDLELINDDKVNMNQLIEIIINKLSLKNEVL